MKLQKQEVAFSNRYLYYYASLIKKIYGFVIRRGEDQPDERYVGHIGEHPQRKDLPSEVVQNPLSPGRDGLPVVGEIILFRFRKRLLFGYCRELLSRQVSEISVQTEDERHIRFHKTNLIYLTGITIKNSGKELYQYAQTIRTLSQQINLKTIWELASESKTPLTFDDISDLYWTDENRDPTRFVSLYLHLHQNCPYFTPNQHTHIPTSQEETDQRILAQNNRKQQADEREEFIHYLQDDHDTDTQSLTKRQQTWFESIRQYALWGQEAERSNDARSILSAVNPQTKNYKRLAFDCLVTKKIWQPNENLDLHRSEIPTTFSTSECEDAKVRFSNYDLKDRKHFQRGLFVIQDADLPHIALSYRKPLFTGPEFCLHIPDLSTVITPHSPCDIAAAERLQTLSLPDQTLALLPQSLSFSTNHAIPTLSLIWRMDRKGRLKSFKLIPSASTVQAKLTADEITRAHHNPAHLYHRAITFFNHLAHRLQERRTPRDGDFDLPDLRLIYKNDTPTISPISNDLAHHILNELRLLAGVATGRWCLENHLPAIYEMRDEVENIEVHQQIDHPIVRRHEIRRLMPKIKKTESPAFHHGFGIALYCPITDPNNHYDHLLMQRQINHHLQHGAHLYNEEHLNILRFQIQEMHAISEGIIYRRQRDLLLQFWANHIGTNFEATVLHIKRHGVLVEFKNAPFKTIVYPSHPVQVGDEITLRLTGINTDQAQAHFTVLQPETLSHP